MKTDLFQSHIAFLPLRQLELSCVWFVYSLLANNTLWWCSIGCAHIAIIKQSNLQSIETICSCMSASNLIWNFSRSSGRIILWAIAIEWLWPKVNHLLLTHSQFCQNTEWNSWVKNLVRLIKANEGERLNFNTIYCFQFPSAPLTAHQRKSIGRTRDGFGFLFYNHSLIYSDRS